MLVVLGIWLGAVLLPGDWRRRLLPFWRQSER